MKGVYLLFFLCFSQFMEGKNATRGVRLEFENNCLTLSKENQIKIINEYLKIEEGDWLYFLTTTANEINENRLLAFKNSKIRNRVIGEFLITNGIEQQNIIYKYNLFENLWINKPAKLKSSVKVENQNDKSNQTIMSFRNIEGALFNLPSGNIMEFKPMSFEGFSEDIITVTVKEYISKSDFVKYGVTANGDKGMLETQGMYHVEAESNNQKISLRRNSTYTLKIKEGKNESPFYSFYGKEQNGQVIWSKNDQEKFYLESSEESNEILPYEEEEYNNGFIEVVDTELVENEYGELEPILIKEIRRLGDDLVGQFSSLGWINCDRFYDAEETITMKLSIDNGISEKGYSVYIIFKDINSVLPLYSVTNGTYKTPEIPKGSTITIFAVQMAGNELKKLAFKEVIASDEQVFNVTSKKVNKNQVEKMMKDIIF